MRTVRGSKWRALLIKSLLDSLYFFCNCPSNTVTYTLSLHDALPSYLPCIQLSAGKQSRYNLRRNQVNGGLCTAECAIELFGIAGLNEKADILEKELIRIPLKTVETFIEFPFLKVHRSYVVNLNQITKISGNSQGMQISLKGLDEIIPVSRNYIEPLKKSILNNA